VTAQNYREQLFSVFTMTLGMTLIMGIILGGWSSLLTNYSIQQAAFVHRVNTINGCLVRYWFGVSLAARAISPIASYTHLLEAWSVCLSVCRLSVTLTVRRV